METNHMLPEEQEAASLMLQRLRKLLPAVKGRVKVAHFRGNNPQRYSGDKDTYLKGGGYYIYGEYPDRENHGDQNRGDYLGCALVMASSGQLLYWQWSGSWSQWQEETCMYHATALGAPDSYYGNRAEEEVDTVGEIVPDAQILGYISLDELAQAVADAEAQAEVNRAKRTERLTARSKRAQEIIQVLKNS